MTGELKSKIDRIWDAFWSGGISTPWRSLSRLLTCSSPGAWTICTPAPRTRPTLAHLDDLTQSIFLDMFGDQVGDPQNFPVKTLIDWVTPTRPITYGIVKPGPDQPAGVPYVRVVSMKHGPTPTRGPSTPNPAEQLRAGVKPCGRLLARRS